MTKFKIAGWLVANLGFMVAVYLIGAFVAADWYWLDGMFTTWDRGDRAIFAYLEFCILLVSGFMFLL